MSRPTDENSFLTRWSRRKRGGEPEEPAEAAEAAVPESAEPPAEDDRPDEEILAELGLPDPDEMEKGADFSVFMKAAVPERIRRRALRKLWRSNPVLAVLDGLNDYDDDFTGDTVAPGMLKTAYQVGRGFVRDAAEEPAAEQPGEIDESGSQDVAEVAPETPELPQVETPEVQVSENSGLSDNPEREESTLDKGPSRRRMSFRFDN